jgi:spermidine synthase
VRAFLDGAPLGPEWTSWARRAALLAALGSSLAVAESLLPVEWLARFPDEIVFSLDGSTSEYAVVASPAGYELYVDRQLAVSPLDETRRIAALVHPALASVRRAERVLLLHGGLGAVERALLADPRIRELVTVTPDAVRADLARTLPFLAARSAGTMQSPRVRTVIAEPLAWLEAHRGASFDVVVADLPLPLGYREGKYYTRFAFDRFRAALAPDGVVVVPGVGDDALAGVTATLKSAGLYPTAYHAAVPTLGIASFVLASPRGEPDVSAPWLDRGADLGRAGDDRIATLSDQWIVEAFEAARERR